MIQHILLLADALIAIALVLVILLQRQDSSGGGIMGGANMGASPVMRNPLAKATAYLGTAFMGISLFLAYLSSGQGKAESIFDAVGVMEPPVVEEQVLVEPIGEMPPVPLLMEENVQ